ncbi:MAG TPA: phospho-N-acetylmuramoyl-pentapeptide-transferase [Phycisphaerae bacterium]|nr:phospho-N-acetylmuramoyl-pentapeptide-transferase [Phycisphaerae bacterium]
MLYHLFMALAGGEHYAHENVLFRGVCAAIFCFAVLLLATPKIIRQLIRYKLGDRPEFDHASLNELTRDKTRVPTMGGLLILAAVAVSTLLFADPLNYYVQMGLVCLVWLGLLGAVDDWFKLTAARRSGTRDGLKSYEKLLFQVGLGVLLGYFVYSVGRTNFAVITSPSLPQEIEAYRILAVPFYKPGILMGTFAFMFISVLVIAGTSNAVNLTDGMDGLASGCVAFCALVFMIMAYVVGNEATAAKLLLPHIPQSGELTVLCGAIIGATVGFLWYNCHPARVFMGDTGSLPLGGLIGYVAIVTRQELMLLIAGGVFVIEAISVILQVGYFKTTGGRRLFLVAPIHHHFHVSGWTEPQTVVRFWITAGLFAALALATIKLR